MNASDATGRRAARGFTLVEILVAMVVLLLLLGMIFSVTATTGRTVGRSTAAIDAFTAGRATFDQVTQRLSQATLNTYYDYFNAAGKTLSAVVASGGSFVPDHYGRQSDLQFLVMQNPQQAGYGQAVYFAAPEAYSSLANQLDAQGMLNACGFYVQYGTDQPFSPGYGGAITPAHRYRYRLMQALEPTESLQMFVSVVANSNPPTWISNVKETATATTLSPNVAPLADNVIALIVWPRLSEDDDSTGRVLAPIYTYDSHPAVVPSPLANNDAKVTANQTNQLPPNVYVTMITISETAAKRLDTNSTTPPTTIENALRGKFADASKYQADLNFVSAALIAANIDYRIFTTSVPMRESKWSSIQ